MADRLPLHERQERAWMEQASELAISAVQSHDRHMNAGEPCLRIRCKVVAYLMHTFLLDSKQVPHILSELEKLKSIQLESSKDPHHH